MCDTEYGIALNSGIGECFGIMANTPVKTGEQNRQTIQSTQLSQMQTCSAHVSRHVQHVKSCEQTAPPKPQPVTPFLPTTVDADLFQK